MGNSAKPVVVLADKPIEELRQDIDAETAGMDL